MEKERRLERERQRLEREREQAKRYGQFIKKYWPLPAVRIPVDPKTFKRQVWYCNCSARLIPELQQFNEYKGTIGSTTDDDNDQRVLLSDEYYTAGYTNYRVYPNGLAFRDINLLSMLFDYYIESNFSPPPKTSDMERLISKLAICDPYNAAISDKLAVSGMPSLYERENRLSMYEISGLFCTGTIVQKGIISNLYLPYITAEFKEGDVVDTEGYRGMGLKILVPTTSTDGKEKLQFVDVPRDEYYPQWPLHLLKKYGFRRLIKSLMWGDDEPLFEHIEIAENIILVSDGEKPFWDENVSGLSKDKADATGPESNKSRSSPQPLVEGHKDSEKLESMLCRNDQDYYVLLPNKSLTDLGTKGLNRLVQGKDKFRYQISEYDVLLIENGAVRFTDGKSENIEFLDCETCSIVSIGESPTVYNSSAFW
jgi:hypothetical protein